MRRTVLIVSLILAVALPALAANVHLKGGKRAEPSFSDGGLTLMASGVLAGLGNGDVLIIVEAVGDPMAVCINPSQKDGKDQQPAGQNPAEVVLTGTEAIPEEEVKNGNTPFGPIQTEEPESPIPGAPECPGSNWSEVITDVSFTSATITVEQPEGNVVLVVECTINPPTEDGIVSRGDVECTQF